MKSTKKIMIISCCVMPVEKISRTLDANTSFFLFVLKVLLLSTLMMSVMLKMLFEVWMACLLDIANASFLLSGQG